MILMKLVQENDYYELLNAKLNTNCPARNDKEYYQDNKDKIQEYRQNNKDKIKEYYENNKDKINAMRKTPYICDICNGKYIHNNRAKHFKSQKHQTALNNND